MRALRRLLTLSVAVLTAGLVGVSPSSGTTVVSTPVNVTQDHFANNEESLGMDPTGMLLAGAWNDWEYNDGCGFSYSTDGGAHWAPESFVPGFTAFTNDPNVDGTGRFGVAGDPSVAWNPAFSTFDVVCQTFGSKTGNQIQLQATTFDPTKADPNADVNASYGAAAWTTPVPVATGKSNGSQKGSNGQLPDHESITVDTSDAPGHHYGRLFVSWAEFSGFGRSPINVAFSDDNGGTWTGPIRVSDKDHQFDQDARVSVAPNGDIYMTWIGGPNEKSLKNNVVEAARSTDGGATWSRTYTVANIVSPVPGVLPNSEYRVFEDVTASVDQATGALVVVYDDMKTGPSTMYATHTQTPGDLTSFTSPVAVAASGKEQFFPWMSAAPNGRVDLVYYDRFCDSGDKDNCVVLASSTDSGASWTTTTVLGTGFDGDQFQACLAFVDPPDCGVQFLGDYIAVGSTNTRAQVLYTGNGSDAMDVFSASVTF
ncbi:MAG: sialidase family protein [Actinomycetota bacterium]